MTTKLTDGEYGVSSESVVASALIVGVCIVLGFLIVMGAVIHREWREARETHAVYP